MSKTMKSYWAKGAVLVSSIIAVGALLALPQSSTASIITTGCSKTNFCSLPELFDGGSIQMDDLLFTNWTLNWNHSVNLSNIEIGQGYLLGPQDDFGIWSRNHEMQATSDWKGVNFDFKVTSLGNTAIIGIETRTAFTALNGYTFDSPYSQTNIDAGTNQGGSDLGTAYSYRTLDSGYASPVINISELTSLWIRQQFFVDPKGMYAEAGYLSSYGEGPGYRTIFTQVGVESPSVPEPGTLGLFGLGLAGLICLGRKRSYY